MRLLNLCCGAARPPLPWTNLDTLRSALTIGTPERTNLDAEPNYIDHDVCSGPLPFPDNAFDGILASHCIEHWDCQEAVRVLRECRRVLAPGGVALVSVPDASYFRSVRHEDTPENAVRLFGEPIHMADGEPTFMDYALFNRFHKQVLTEDALWCILIRSGFVMSDTNLAFARCKEITIIESLLNRRRFSLKMLGFKP